MVDRNGSVANSIKILIDLDSNGRFVSRDEYWDTDLFIKTSNGFQTTCRMSFGFTYDSEQMYIFYMVVFLFIKNKQK